MDAQAALQTFLTGALVRKRGRYLGFIAKPKTQAKFLDAIYHDLEADLDRSKQIQELPRGAGRIPGFRFAPPKEFGTLVDDLQGVCDSADDSFLVVSDDGEIGIHGPETMLDDRTIYRIGRSGSQTTT